MKRTSTAAELSDFPQTTSKKLKSDTHDWVARLETVTKNGSRWVLPIPIHGSLSIGRSPKSDCVILEPVVSATHCRLYALSKGSHELTVSCLDTSTNGILINGYKVRRSWSVLGDGDSLEIPHSQIFTLKIRDKYTNARKNPFEPTPPSVLSMKCIGKYKVTSRCLGRGTFATVNLAVELGAYRQIACKTTRPKNVELRGTHTVMKEVTILKSLCHPNINKVLDVVMNESWLHIFLELATGGDLFTYITSGKHPNYRLHEDETRYITYQLLKGLDYMHNLHVSHRGKSIFLRVPKDLDPLLIYHLKPENVLLHDPGPYPRITIADFGLARQKAYQPTFNAVGTVPYMPPEAICALTDPTAKYVGKPADCWSLGCCIYSMLSGAHPFDREMGTGHLVDVAASESSVQREAREEYQVKSRIVEGPMNFPEEIWKKLPQAKVLVGSLLIHDPVARYTVKDAFSSDWIKLHKKDLHVLYKSRIQT